MSWEVVEKLPLVSTTRGNALANGLQPKLRYTIVPIEKALAPIHAHLAVPAVGLKIWKEWNYPSSIEYIWDHEFCHLGCWAVKEKFLKRRNFCSSKQLFEVVLSCFEGQKFNFWLFSLLCSVHTKKLHNKKILNFFLPSKSWKNHLKKLLT